MLQIVAGVVLAQRAQAVPGLAVGQHDLQAQDQIAHIAVVQDGDAAGIGREIAPDAATSLRRQAKRKQAIGNFGSLLDMLQDAAGFHCHRVICRIDRADAVHPLQGKDEAAPLGQRNAAAHQSGIAGLWHDRNASRPR